MARTVAIVQARMSSTRLPGKVMREIHGHPAIYHVLTRTARAKRVDAVWLACSSAPADNKLADYARKLGFAVFRGDESDVLGRYAAAAREAEASAVVRVTGDCPMIDHAVLDLAVERFHAGDVDYVSNTLSRTYPDGLDVEVFGRGALDRAAHEARDPYLREHVTPYIHGHGAGRPKGGNFRIAQIAHAEDFKHLRWTLDDHDDLEFLRRLFPLLPQGFGWMDAVAVLTRLPQLLRINSGHTINEASELVPSRGAKQSFVKSEAFFERAGAVIPMASQTFSKSHEQWVKGAAPLFLTHGRGARVWDVDGNSYVDHVLGLLPIVLGYRDPDVDLAIAGQLEKGIVFPLASPLETELAERLRRLIPCAEMVRYGKNGSDATTAAVRLARACTGRDKVVVCGYHGWHDWYIGTTSRRLGVPAAIQALSLALPFGDADAVEAAFAREPKGYAAVVLEPAGGPDPKTYLERLRAICDRYGVVLVFDEIVSGFRIGLGGAQAHYGVTPDLACFGKAMANGMPISAIVGRAALMQRMEDIFFSGTFGGEALSLAAAIATIDKLERERVPARLWAAGDRLVRETSALLRHERLDGFIEIVGEGWWPRFAIVDPPVDPILLQSLLRQEFVAQGLLLAASFNLCLAHEEEGVFDETLKALRTALADVRAALDAPDPAARLRGRPIRPTFRVRAN
jgi:glutamate-1-semialdehyde 2,1-aminomutase/spore coat polysaccharide biosynthesis protein SpsF